MVLRDRWVHWKNGGETQDTSEDRGIGQINQTQDRSGLTRPRWPLKPVRVFEGFACFQHSHISQCTLAAGREGQPAPALGYPSIPQGCIWRLTPGSARSISSRSGGGVGRRLPVACGRTGPTGRGVAGRSYSMSRRASDWGIWTSRGRTGVAPYQGLRPDNQADTG